MGEGVYLQRTRANGRMRKDSARWREGYVAVVWAGGRRVWRRYYAVRLYGRAEARRLARLARKQYLFQHRGTS